VNIQKKADVETSAKVENDPMKTMSNLHKKAGVETPAGESSLSYKKIDRSKVHKSCHSWCPNGRHPTGQKSTPVFSVPASFSKRKTGPGKVPLLFHVQRF